jgi:hypothetical protein
MPCVNRYHFSVAQSIEFIEMEKYGSNYHVEIAWLIKYRMRVSA